MESMQQMSNGLQVGIKNFVNWDKVLFPGGGCLNLIKYVAEELGLEEGDITGTWDHAHVMQLVWHRCYLVST